MATRPMKDYNVTFTDEYRKIGSYDEIELNGLGEAEIGEIILQNFDSGVNRISPEIVRVIQVHIYSFTNELLTHLIICFAETYWWQSFICQVCLNNPLLQCIIITKLTVLGIWQLF
jgi:hypothetical protein